MQARVNLGNGVVVVGDGTNPADVFQQIASMSEAFGENECGKCKGKNLRFAVRTVQDGKKSYTYYEMRCQDCRAKLAMGQGDDGVLYPNRFQKDEDGNYVLNEKGFKAFKGSNGWTRYNRETKQEE